MNQNRQTDRTQSASRSRGVAALWFFVVLVAGLAVSAPRARAQESGKNILYVRFDTVTIQPKETDVFVNAYYSFVAPKPHDLHGYNAHFFYDSTQVRVVDLILAGTASENVGSAELNPHPPEAAVVVLGSPHQELDFTNPILFKVRLTAKQALTDTTFLRWDYIDIPDYFGVDSIVLQDGWIRRLKPREDIVLSSPKDTVQADSTLKLPITLSDASNANLRQARLRLQIDTSVLEYRASAGDSAAGSVVTSAGMNGDTLVVDLAATPQSSFITGNAPIVTLALQAKKRFDTVSTTFRSASLVPLNSDALIANITFRLDTIRVLGTPKPSNVVGPAGSETELQIRVFPNPATTNVTVETAGGTGSYRVVVSDLLGRTVYTSTSEVSAWKLGAGLAPGSYTITVEDTRSGERATARMTVLR